MSSELIVGVLSLQGDFERHLYRLSRLKMPCREVRTASDLIGLNGLIIPGGESTTMNILIDRFDFRRKLREFCTQKAVWGTCAGMIMLAREVDDRQIEPLGIIDIAVSRNAYGRQVHSFHSEVNANLNGTPASLKASFIRAPIVTYRGPGVRVLAEHEKRPVLLVQGNCLVSSFHTELDDDLSLTKYFIDKIVAVYK